MAVQNTFDCDLCETTNVSDGVTMVYGHNMSGDHKGPRYSLTKVLNHLAVVHDSPKSQHICTNCVDKIKAPVDK